jgi:hypothetical protein
LRAGASPFRGSILRLVMDRNDIPVHILEMESHVKRARSGFIQKLHALTLRRRPKSYRIVAIEPKSDTVSQGIGQPQVNVRLSHGKWNGVSIEKNRVRLSTRVPARMEPRSIGLVGGAAQLYVMTHLGPDRAHSLQNPKHIVDTISSVFFSERGRRCRGKRGHRWTRRPALYSSGSPAIAR